MSTYDLLLDPELIYKVGRTLSEDRFKKTNLRSTPSDEFLSSDQFIIKL